VTQPYCPVQPAGGFCSESTPCNSIFIFVGKLDDRTGLSCRPFAHFGEIMRKVLGFVLLMWGCSGPSAKAPVLPEHVAPSWTRSTVQPIEASQLPMLLQSAGIKQGWKTEYRSAGGALARVETYAIRSNTQGLDLVQRWQPVRDHAQFYTDHYLLNVSWEQAQHDELASLVRSLPKMVEGQP